MQAGLPLGLEGKPQLYMVGTARGHAEGGPSLAAWALLAAPSPAPPNVLPLELGVRFCALGLAMHPSVPVVFPLRVGPWSVPVVFPVEWALGGVQAAPGHLQHLVPGLMDLKPALAPPASHTRRGHECRCLGAPACAAFLA